MAVVIDYIDTYRHEVVEDAPLGAESICRELRSSGGQIASSTYYAAMKRPPSARARQDAELVALIRKTHTENLGVYGARKIHAELNRKGHRVARCTVERLMRAEGIQGLRREQVPKTTITDGDQNPMSPADLVERTSTAEAPNRLWVADLT